MDRPRKERRQVKIVYIDELTAKIRRNEQKAKRPIREKSKSWITDVFPPKP